MAITLSTPTGGNNALPIAVGEQIRFTKKFDALGVANGTTAQVTAIKPGKLKASVLTVQLNGQSHELSLAMITGPSDRASIRHFYASTLYGAQGATVDRVYVLLSPALGRNEIYVATSRACKNTRLFVDREGLSRAVLDGSLLSDRVKPEFSDRILKRHLVNSFSKVTSKISALDYLPINAVKTAVAKPIQAAGRIPLLDR